MTLPFHDASKRLGVYVASKVGAVLQPEGQIVGGASEGRKILRNESKRADWAHVCPKGPGVGGQSIHSGESSIADLGPTGEIASFKARVYDRNSGSGSG
jgi:hypothetical protein